MWLAANFLYLVLLITGALTSRPVDNFPTGFQSSSHSSSLGLLDIPFPNEEVIQKNAPFYLQRLISTTTIWPSMKLFTDLTYTYKWNPSASGENVVVYVIDSGIDGKNPEFEGRASDGWSFDGNFDDKSGHGTLCASMVGGRQFGVAKKVRLEAVVVVHGSVGTVDDLIGGLDYVLRKCKDKHVKHACIASISMLVKTLKDGNVQEDLDDKVRELIDAGVHVVVSAGNGGTDRRHSPAGVPGAITVGALDRFDVPARCSNYGDHVDIWASGENIIALSINDTGKLLKEQNKISVSGASFATTQVVGIIALLISAHGNMRPQDMKDKVIQMGIRDKIPGLYNTPSRSKVL